MSRGDAMRAGRAAWLVPLGYLATVVVLVVCLLRILASGTDPANTSAPGYLPLAWAAAAILLAVFVAAAFVRSALVRTSAALPWLVGVASFAVSLVPWLALYVGNTDLGSAIYRGLRVPQGIVQFWDTVLPLKSIDCAAVGVDVYAANNGCLQDPTIYGPGVLWLRWVPFDLFSERYVTGFGVLGILLSSLALLWLARRSTGLGQILLLVAAVGGPWLLLLERGNLDATLLWGAVLVVSLVTRLPRLWAWWVAAAVIWVLGTWKYYPFVMGLMLLPALRLRRGWTVLVGFLVASIGFMLLTWETFRFSAQSNSNMIDMGDFVVLGRVPVVARMLGTVVGAGGVQLGDALLFLLALCALVWGVFVALSLRGKPVSMAMLAVAGGSLFLASVLLAGFGWGYKATFLLLAVPLVSRLVAVRSTAGRFAWIVTASALTVLLLIGIDAVVVWNTVLVTLAGIIAASFALGAGVTIICRTLVAQRSAGVAVATSVDA